MKATKSKKKEEAPANQLSRTAVVEYVPVIRALIASIETERMTVKNYEKAQWLYVHFLDEEFGSSKVDHTMDVISVWLEGSQFSADCGGIKKLKKDTEWIDLLDLLHKKLLDFKNYAPIIVVSFSESGRMTRMEDGFSMHSDFAPHSQTAGLIRLLGKHDGYVSTDQICETIRCAGIEGLNTLKDRLNKKLERDLQLPKAHKFIDSKRLSGYRVGHIYNIVFTTN